MVGIFIILLLAILLVIKFCKKNLKIVLSIIIIIIALYCVILSIDISRVNSSKEPVFAVKVEETDLTYKTIIYQGLGYKVNVKKDVTKENDKIIKIEMYMFNKCIAGVR